MVPHSMDTVGALIAGSDEIVQPDELLFLAQHAGLDTVKNDVIEYGESVAELVVRRMIMMAKMTFMAAYGYYTYSFEGGFAVADPSDDEDGYYIQGEHLEPLIDDAYQWLQGVLLD